MTEFWIAGGLFLSLMFGSFGVIWKINVDTKKSVHARADKTEVKINEITKDVDIKVSRVYKRFDEYKDHLEKTHVSKEIHDLTYNQLKDDIGEIKTDVKSLLKKANGVS